MPSGEARRALVPLLILRGAGGLVFVASLVAGSRALVTDTRRAFRDAGPSNFPATVVDQLRQVRGEVPTGDRILLVSASRTDGAWYARLFQRALYPRNEVIVRYLPLSEKDADDLRRAWSIRYGMALELTPTSPKFVRARDLGPLPAMSDRVWVGVLAP